MTTIVALKTPKGVKFAWDSQTTWMGRAMLGGDKVFRNGPVTFGVSGLGRTSDILKHLAVPERKEYEPGYDDERWVVNSLVPSIITEMKKVSATDPSDFDSESSIILVVGDLVGYLSSNGSYVSDEKGVYAVGSGSPYALGALSNGASPKKAVEIAKEWDLYTGGEVKELAV